MPREIAGEQDSASDGATAPRTTTGSSLRIGQVAPVPHWDLP